MKPLLGMNRAQYLTRVWSAKGWQTRIGYVVWEQGRLPFKKSCRNPADKFLLTAAEANRLKIKEQEKAA